MKKKTFWRIHVQYNGSIRRDIDVGVNIKKLANIFLSLFYLHSNK